MHENMVLIPAGEFLMGADDCNMEERPAHKVFVGAFYLDKYMVTVKDYREFSAATGYGLPRQPRWSGDAHPVVMVTWQDAMKYCEWAKKRLPTEAEWEKAARGGTATKYSFGDDAARLGEYAWFKDNSGGTIQKVGLKKPNQFGLYDMHGNAWQWVSDLYNSGYYAKSPERDPQGPAAGTDIRVQRGGQCRSEAHFLRCSCRGRSAPDLRHPAAGFRCAAAVRP